LIYLKIYRREIEQVCQQGMALRSQGLFDGQVMMRIIPGNKCIVFAMIASNPDLDYIVSMFLELIQQSYHQCIPQLFIVLYFNLMLG
jgi:hypothetical protein